MTAPKSTHGGPGRGAKTPEHVLAEIEDMKYPERVDLIAKIECTPSGKTWGGPGRGGARPLVADEPTRRVNVSLDPATIERAKELGDGNLSAGIRRAVRRAT